MQTTLLAIAIAIILALVAALAGPYFVDWNDYRAAIEAQASRIAGATVRVHGPIEVRLLPIPSIAAGQVEMAGVAAGDARELKVEFAFAPLLRGEWRATEVRLVGAALVLTIDERGRIEGTPPFADLSPQTVSVERLSVEDGRMTLLDRSGGVRAAAEKIWFMGELKSLLGPLKGEGGFAISGERYGFRLNVSRPEEAGAKTRLLIDPADSAPSFDIDGSVRFEAGVPLFEGKITAARAEEATEPNNAAGAGWRATASHVRANPSKAVSEDFELQYGPDDRAVKLTGVAELSLWEKPAFEAILSSRRADLDKLLAPADGRRLLPVEAVRALAALWDKAPLRGVPTRIGVTIENMTAGGGQVQNLQAELASTADGWDVERLEFRGPGRAQIRLSGAFGLQPGGVSFEGPARIEAENPALLLAWLEGRAGVTAMASPLSASGTVAVGPERMALEDLKARIDGKTIHGRMLYLHAAERPARLEAELKADDVDLDALGGSLQALFGRDVRSFPTETKVTLDLGAARLFGAQGKSIAASLQLDGQGLVIDRLSIGDLGGARVSAQGRIAEPFKAPQGSLTLDVSAGKLDGLLAVLTSISPGTAEQIRRVQGRLAPLQGRLRLKIDRQEGTQASTAQLGLEARAGIARIGLIADAAGDIASPASATWRIDGRLEAEEGPVLAAVLGIDRLVIVDRRPAWVRLVANTEKDGAVRLDARLNAGGLDASAKGAMQGLDAQRLSGSFDVSIAAADVSALLHWPDATGSRTALPFTLKTRLELDRRAISASALYARVAGGAVHGNLAVRFDNLGAKPEVTGRLEAESADPAAVFAIASGALANAASDGGWSAEPFKPLIGWLSGSVEVRTARLPLTGALAGRDVRATIRLGEDSLAVEDMDGSLGGGRMTGRIVMTRRNGALDLRSKFGLRGAELSFDPAGDGRQPINAKFDLQGEVEGGGLSPATLVGSLSGAASFSIEQATFSGLDARAFDAAIRAADSGLPLDAPRIAEVVARSFDAGRLTVKRSEGALAMTAGQIRIAPLQAGPDESLEVSGLVDLLDRTADVRFLMRGPPDPAVSARPELIVSLRGPVNKMRRTTDVAPLLAWLTLRSVEKQTKRLENIEASRAREEEAIKALEQRSNQQKLEQQRAAPLPEPAQPPAGPPAGSPGTGARAPSLSGRGDTQAPPAALAPALPPPIDIRPPGSQDRKPASPLPRPSTVTGPKQSNIPSTLPGGAILNPLVAPGR